MTERRFNLSNKKIVNGERETVKYIENIKTKVFDVIFEWIIGITYFYIKMFQSYRFVTLSFQKVPSSQPQVSILSTFYKQLSTSSFMPILQANAGVSDYRPVTSTKFPK